MYSLRQITENGAEYNRMLGNYYSLDKYSEVPTEGEMFNNRIAVKLGKEGSVMTPEDLAEYVADTKHYATVTGENAQSLDLFKGSRYFIVCSNGQTYANLTKR
jgi:hypothetical protein